MESLVLSVDGFAALYDRHARALLSYCAQRVGPVAAEDVVAQVFLTAYERRERFDPGRAEARAWLYGIATNILRRHRRDEVRGYRALARTGMDPLSTVQGVIDSHAQRAAERVDASTSACLVAAVLAGLPRRQRDVLLLYALADLGYAEIAEVLGIPLGSVQSALFRARTKLRTALAKE